MIANYPGRIGFTDANSSPEPNDYNQHGGIYMHLHRHANLEDVFLKLTGRDGKPCATAAETSVRSAV